MNIKEYSVSRINIHVCLVFLCMVFVANGARAMIALKKDSLPNVIIIYADDLGYGDISCYGATKIHTPHIDRLAQQGLKFTNAYATSSTCTPSRYSLLTGQYAWRKEGTGIAAGDAPLIIDTNRLTLAGMFKQVGYQTGVIGKWHLGLGKFPRTEWNNEVKPGPNELSFDYSFIIPATLDRVPTIFVKNHHIVHNDPNDPITVNYKVPVGDEPTGKEHPELLTMMYSHGHDQTIVNGISRIGYMSGGKAARWKDEELAPIFAREAAQFMVQNKERRFFLYYALSDIHVPRLPNERFVGKSGLGPRGDVILQLDWTVGQLLGTLDSLKLTENTLIIFSSDNGPVLDDGYQDDAVEKQNGHKPGGDFRGGKYSKYEAGTRVPFIVQWPGVVQQSAISSARISQVDLFASLAELTHQQLKKGDAPDSHALLQVLLGKSQQGREWLVEQGNGLALIKNNWKYIEPSSGQAINKFTNIELGNSPSPQLYNLQVDPGETNNLSTAYPDKVKEMHELMTKIKHADLRSTAE